jgi:hypothetical protein
MNRAHRQANLREYLRGAAYVRVLEGIAGHAHTLDQDDVPGYALKAKIYLALLAKVLPDLKAVELSGSITGKPEELTDDRLTHIATGSGNRAIEAPAGPKEPDSVH